MRKIKHCIVFSIILCLAIAPFMKTTTFALSKASNSFLWPVDYTSDTYWISALDVYSSGKSHSKGYGMDIYDDGEGIVYAVADGEIVSTYNGCKHVNKSNDTCNGGYGNYIKIKHTDGTYSLYAHLKRGSLTSSKKVKAGDAIAKIGSSGSSSGPHLHFEIFTSDNKKDYAFDYYKSNSEYQSKYVFREGLKNSPRYGDWIKENYKSQYTTKSGNAYLAYSGAVGSYGTVYIQYNANGGNGAPSSHKVAKDSNGTAVFYLSTTRPKRSGYTFLGWRLENSTAYGIDSPGALIAFGTGNVQHDTVLTYYAQWKKESESIDEYRGTVFIQYDANGGSGAPPSHWTLKDSNGVAFYKLSTTRPTRSGYTFLGWRLENSTAYGIDSPGDSIAIDTGNVRSNTILTYYAQWKKDGTLSKPKNFKIVMMTSSTALVSWDPVDGATSYEVEYWSRSWNQWRADYEYSPYLGTKTTSYVTKGLSNHPYYEFRVRAKSSSGVSEWEYFTYYK